MSHFYIDQNPEGGHMLAADVEGIKRRLFLTVESPEDQITLELLQEWVNSVHPPINLQNEIEKFVEWAGNEPDDQPYGDDVVAAVRAYLAWREQRGQGEQAVAP